MACRLHWDCSQRGLWASPSLLRQEAESEHAGAQGCAIHADDSETRPLVTWKMLSSVLGVLFKASHFKPRSFD